MTGSEWLAKRCFMTWIITLMLVPALTEHGGDMHTTLIDEPHLKELLARSCILLVSIHFPREPSTVLTINISNTLSTDCVHASSINMFKNRIDKYLVKAGYT